MQPILTGVIELGNQTHKNQNLGMVSRSIDLFLHSQYKIFASNKKNGITDNKPYALKEYFHHGYQTLHLTFHSLVVGLIGFCISSSSRISTR